MKKDILTEMTDVIVFWISQFPTNLNPFIQFHHSAFGDATDSACTQTLSTRNIDVDQGFLLKSLF